MKTKQLGNTDLHITTIGLGTFAIGGSGWEYAWGPQDDEDSISAIIAAIESGINWIDTAAIYGLGHSEEVVGRAIKQLKPKPVIATKCGITWDSSGKVNRSVDRKVVRADVEASLRRLDLEPIDLYQIHWPFPDEKIEESWEEMAKLAEEGKVRHIGVSNYSVSQLERIRPIYPVASLQPPYSMLVRDIEENLLNYCGENNIGVICYSPIQKGLLTGKFSAERVANLPADDHRRNDPNFTGQTLEKNLEIVERLKLIAQRNDKTPAQLAIAWVLRRQEVTAAIVGARKKEQITETALAADWEIGQEDLTEIEEILKG